MWGRTGSSDGHSVFPFLGHEVSVPAQNRVWRVERTDFFEHPASQNLAFDGQSTPQHAPH